MTVPIGKMKRFSLEQKKNINDRTKSEACTALFSIVRFLATPQITHRQKGAHVPLSMEINATVSSNIRFKLREQLFTVVSNAVVIDVHNYD